MRSIMLAVFSLSFAVSGAHAASEQPSMMAKRAAKRSSSDKPTLIATSPEGTKTYRMPSGREVTASSRWGEINVVGPNYSVTNSVLRANEAARGSKFDIRTVVDKRGGKRTIQSIELSQKDARFVGMENLRTQSGSWTSVQQATYWEGGKQRAIVIPPGASQIEERPAQIDEAQIAQQYSARKQRKADVEHAFGGKAR